MCIRDRRVDAKEIICKVPYRFPLAERVCKQPDTRAIDRIATRRIQRARDPEEEGEEEEDGDEDEAGQSSVLPAPNPGSEDRDFTDHWVINQDLLIRIHNVPRHALYVPSEEDLPIPIKYLDVSRTTQTDIEEPVMERVVIDFWTT